MNQLTRHTPSYIYIYRRESRSWIKKKKGAQISRSLSVCIFCHPHVRYSSQKLIEKKCLLLLYSLFLYISVIYIPLKFILIIVTARKIQTIHIHISGSILEIPMMLDTSTLYIHTMEKSTEKFLSSIIHSSVVLIQLKLSQLHVAGDYGNND